MNEVDDTRINQDARNVLENFWPVFSYPRAFSVHSQLHAVAHP